LRNKIPYVLLWALLFFFNSKTFSQSLRYSISMPYVSLGAYSTKQLDPFSFTNNQAALAQRRFLLTENSVYGVALALPSKMGNFGIQANYGGFSNFAENKVGLAYARSLGSKVDLGIQFNYYGYRIPGYNNSSTMNFEIGAILHLTDKLNAGIHVYNPVGGKLDKYTDEKLASAYKFGLGYDASENFYVSGEIIKEEDKPVNVIAGIQYQFAKQFFARAGFISETGGGFAGAGVSWNNLRLDVSASYHPQLGISPGLLLIVNFKGAVK
jgi:hypothetical protein